MIQQIMCKNKKQIMSAVIGGFLLILGLITALFSNNLLSAKAAPNDPAVIGGEYWWDYTEYFNNRYTGENDSWVAVEGAGPVSGLIINDNRFGIGIIPSVGNNDFYFCITIDDGLQEVKHLSAADFMALPSYDESDSTIDFYSLFSASGHYKVYFIYEYSQFVSNKLIGKVMVFPPYEFDFIKYIDLPEAPTKTGYEFEGWYYDEELTIPYQGEPITDNTDLHAKMTPIDYNITYNLNGGTLTGAKTTYNIESSTYNLPNPSKNFYTFDGWYSNASFSGAKITKIDTGSYGDKSYYAKYTPITYTITYELNGGSMTGQTNNYNVESNVIYLPTAYKNGYVFGGWYTSPTFSTSPVTAISTGSNGDKVYYAKFTPVEYSITYYLNGGSMTGHEVTYNTESSTYTLPAPTLTGYTFKGWYTDSAFVGSPITTIPQGSTGNKTFYAKWEIIKFTVKFYLDGVIYRELTVPYGSVLDGYYYADSQMLAVNFFVDPNLTAEYDLTSAVYNDISLYVPTDFDLYVTLTYSVNGSVIATDMLAYNAPMNNLRTAEREGYIFGGWFYDEAFTKPVLSSDKLTTNATIYAKLTEKEEVSFWDKCMNWFKSTIGKVVTISAVAVIVVGGIYVYKKKR